MVCLQEIKSWQTFTSSQYQFYTGIKSDCGILIRSNLNHLVKAVAGGERWFAVLVGDVAICSMHAVPASTVGNPTAKDPYAECYDEVDLLLRTWADPGRAKNFLIGIDANVSLPANLEDMTGGNVLVPKTNPHRTRQTRLIEFMAAWNLRAVNTWSTTKAFPELETQLRQRGAHTEPDRLRTGTGPRV